MADFKIRALLVDDWPQVEAIYAAGIDTGHATFEEHPPDWEAFDHAKLPNQRIVAVHGSDATRVVGWAAASAVSDRCVYAGVVEHSVYVDPRAQGGGVGHALLARLVEITEAAGIWTIQSGIFPENGASLAVHASAGFRVIGTRERVGLMTYGPRAGSWRDVTFLERRSRDVGT